MRVKTILVRRMPEDLWRKLKARCASEGKTLQEAVALAIKRYLESA